MIKPNRCLFTACLLITLSIYSQESSPKKWKFAFQLDNRFSSIRKTDIAIFGAKIGVQYKNTTRFGVGGSFILNPVSFEYFNKKLKTNETNIINFWYASVFNDWILYKKNNWECFVTEQVGYGKPSFLKEVNDNIVSDANVGLFVNEISGQANYKVNSWLGAGAGLGYRNILNSNARLKTTFNAPIYILKIIIYPEAIFK
jgi:hypothetical protein